MTIPLIDVAPMTQDEMPLPWGVMASSGSLLPALDPILLNDIDEDGSNVQARGRTESTDFLVVADVDPNDLTQSGWSILFPTGQDPAIRVALEPLIEHRRSQIRDQSLFRVFDGSKAYQQGMTVRNWLELFNLGLSVVDPVLGVPLYITIIGGPDEIPFEFQYLLDTYWNVGRIAFDTPAEYRVYSEKVVAYETAPTILQTKRVTIFNPANLGDRATGLLHNQVAVPLVEGTTSSRPLGQRQNYVLQPLLGDNATRDNLKRVFGGQMPGGRPALLFTGSHGVGYSFGDPLQRERQGAILCQDWEGGSIRPEHCFAAEDITDDVHLDGLIHFFFACYGGGCPAEDTYSRVGSTPIKIMEKPIVARLPQKMLAAGALASLAHIDRAWSYSFQVGRSAPQVQEFRDIMVRLLRGDRIGFATDQFNLRWTVLSAELTDSLRQRDSIAGHISDGVLANRWIARDDARNYLILGDPAIRLRVADMQAE
jgi:hypothetical protein